MSLSMYQASVPVFVRALTNLAHVLDLGKAHAESIKAAPDGLLQQRLIFDMFPLIKQVQIACDIGARSSARLAGVEPKSFPDEETTLVQAQERIARTLDYVRNFKEAPFEGSEGRTIELHMRSGDMTFNGRDYLFDFALPTLFFHCTTAYAILRVAGVPIGKKDFLGGQ